MQNRAELSIDLARDIEGEKYYAPFFRYAISSDKVMENFSRNMNVVSSGLAHAVKLVVDSGKGSFADGFSTLMLDYLRPKNIPSHIRLGRSSSRKDPNAEMLLIYFKQMRDVLVGNALVYLLSDGNFPKDFAINAGDWMFRPKPSGGFEMTLITVRGSWEYLGSDAAWVERMKNHIELDPSGNGTYFYPFVYLNDEALTYCLQEAKRLIKK